MDTPSQALALVVPTRVPTPYDPLWGHWLTPAEISFSHGFRRACEHLAARKAAKEAVARLLGCPADPRTWHAMEVHRVPGTAPTMALHGAPAQRLQNLRLPQPGISLTHANGYAAALAWFPARSAET
ncbi:phosphopantetheinyl transferase (holo-ACP synthase) [Streptomyces griseochromogenes]|uniref:Phosphopantetheinyl transferase (Holo-ACP synthase) n=1 Tax=Streptomyces griseochromogenes TaxID=68214 RepID=A0A1B1B0C4_9ACTN|nr:hypothetical protein [Streptomyces griseochromogenes]ANP52259.1 hypothetical protein AVL59_24320 [Streptomyces griseochromogenes]MBP2055634.1 phosphopantetheinyl transferase (holo-ACP synthase) [Streptomyces griseochromogenes]